MFFFLQKKDKAESSKKRKSRGKAKPVISDEDDETDEVWNKRIDMWTVNWPNIVWYICPSIRHVLPSKTEILYIRLQNSCLWKKKSIRI